MAERIDNTAYLVGMDSSLDVYLLVDVAGSADAAPLRLKNLDVRFGVDCRVVTSEGTESLRLATLHCTADDPRVGAYFVGICDSLVALLGAKPTASELRLALDGLASIFLSLSAERTSEWIGLIGELELIRASDDAAYLLSGWRLKGGSRFDFTLEAARVEVKATSLRTRAHHITYEQANQGDSLPTVFASMFVELVQSGTSVQDLIDELADALPSLSSRFAFFDKIASTLGSDVVSTTTVAYDADLTRSSIQYFRATDVPAIRGDLPGGVSRVGFLSDFSTATPLAALDALDLINRRSGTHP